MSQSGRVFRWVFVCTGNRCRSPFAAAYVAARTRGLPVEVSSVGTLDYPGLPSPPELVDLAAAQDLTLAEHRSQPFVASLRDADLVVGFELVHAATATQEGDADPAKTFILPELARLLARLPMEPTALPEDPVTHARAAIAAASRARRAEDPYEMVTDPFGGPLEDYAKMVRTVGSLCASILGVLFPTVAPAANDLRQPDEQAGTG